MSAIPTLSLVIPAFNEAKSILGTLAAIQAGLEARTQRYELIVVADGNDGTRELLAPVAVRDHRISVLGDVARGGKGRAIRHGVARASGEVIGFVDADNKTPIEDLWALLPWLADGFDVVIGSRAVHGARIEVRQPAYRRVGSRLFAVAMHLLVGLWRIHDTQCGFKFFRAAVARDLFARQRIDGYMFDVEVLCLAERNGYRIKEVGVHWRDDADSRLDLVAGNWRNMLDLFRIRFGATAPAPGVDREPTPAAKER